jgi:hypothetical protein
MAARSHARARPAGVRTDPRSRAARTATSHIGDAFSQLHVGEVEEDIAAGKGGIEVTCGTKGLKILFEEAPDAAARRERPLLIPKTVLEHVLHDKRELLDENDQNMDKIAGQRVCGSNLNERRMVVAEAFGEPYSRPTVTNDRGKYSMSVLTANLQRLN